MNPGEQMYVNHPPKDGRGAMVGSIIVILVLIGGAIYYFSSVKTDATPAPAVEETVTPEQTAPAAPTDETTSQLQQQSNSDSIADIEADAQATDLTTLDQNL